METTDARHHRIVQKFLKEKKDKLHQDLEWYSQKKQPDFESAFREAVHARTEKQKRERHQARLPKSVIPKAYRTLLPLMKQLEEARTWDEIFTLIDGALSPIRGAGDLYIYDTALRIGVYRDIYPDKVYLQSGARRGAIKLDKDLRARCYPLSKFGNAFQCLQPVEMENLLCTFRSSLDPDN